MRPAPRQIGTIGALLVLHACSFTSSLEGLLCPSADPNCEGSAGKGSSSPGPSGGGANAAGGNGAIAGSPATAGSSGGATDCSLGRCQDALAVLYFNDDSKLDVGRIRAFFRIRNFGQEDVPLSELTIRYYYTIESGAAQVYTCVLFAQTSCANLIATFGTSSAPGANRYLELGFDSVSSLPSSGGDTGEIKGTLRNEDFSNYHQGDDYSFDGTDAPQSYVRSPHIALYRKGKLIDGKEP